MTVTAPVILAFASLNVVTIVLFVFVGVLWRERSRLSQDLAWADEWLDWWEQQPVVEDWLTERNEWSARTFGPKNTADPLRATALIAHLRLELDEIEADPTDQYEWVDLIMIGLDGLWRYGNVEPDYVIEALKAKYAINLNRTWPAPGSLPPDAPVTHIRHENESTPPQ